MAPILERLRHDLAMDVAFGEVLGADDDRSVLADER
jgi:hypothetical protein